MFFMVKPSFVATRIIGFLCRAGRLVSCYAWKINVHEELSLISAMGLADRHMLFDFAPLMDGRMASIKSRY